MFGAISRKTAIAVNWWSIGSSILLNCSAAPRLYLASLPEAIREELLKQHLHAMTPHSLTDPDQFRTQPSSTYTTMRENVVCVGILLFYWMK
ncbi:MAG: hypothetical protein COC23_05070 [Hyphomicrobiales bacterium]|nr:MAG: hypothetical protein COC23_05070 [Hyphomicrobiales bacterium]